MTARRWAPVALLAAFAALAVTSMRRKSITGDEVTHLPAGYTYVKTGDFRLNPQHPPLIKALAGIPLLFLNLKPVEETAGWAEAREWKFGRDFLVHNRVPIERIVFLGRLPMVAAGVLLGAVLFLWARDLWGYGPGLFVLFLYSLSPNFLAYTRIVHTDVGVACFSTLTLYFLWKFSRSGRPMLLLWCGLALGLALLAKYSAVVTVAVVAALLVPACEWKLWRQPDSAAEQVPALPPGSALARLAQLSGATLLVFVPPLVLITVGFGFPAGLADYVNGFRKIHADLNPHWQGFLWGEYSKNGFWYYYLLAQLWKTPIPALACFAGSLFLVSLRSRRTTLDWAFLLLPIAAFHGAAMIRPASIGVRHVLPAFPFLFLSCGATARWVAHRGWAHKTAFAALCLWYAAGTLRVYPHFIPYFNELTGGPDGGNLYLDDSNIEWGQDFYLLRDYIRRTQPEKVRISAFKPIRPEHYGIQWEVMSLKDVVWPQPGITYIAGASYLQRNSLYNDFPGVRFHWLERYEPIDKIGWSLFVYRFSTDPADAGRADVVYVPKARWFNEAIESLQNMLGRAPRFHEASEVLAEVRATRGDWEATQERWGDAVRDVLAAMRLAPRRLEYRRRAGIWIPRFGATVRIDPSRTAGYYYTEAFRQGRAGATFEALRAYYQCLRKDPRHLGAHFNLGQLYARLGVLRMAEEKWRTCLHIRPGYPPALRSLAEARKLIEQATGAGKRRTEGHGQ